MKIRNKKTGQIHEVLAGTLYPSFFEEVKDDDIKVGEPTIEATIETEKPEPAKKTKAKTTTKKTKKAKKGAKKDGAAKTE